MNDNEKIVDYWNRRKVLSTSEWTDFYCLVVPLLMRTRLPADYNDESRRRDLVNMFFQDKILFNAATSKAGPLQNAHALHGYLKNYEADLRRALHDHDSLDELHHDEGFQVPQDDAVTGQQHAYTTLLAEAGIDIADAIESADRFVETLEKGEQAYLYHHSCADKDDAEPVSGIAKRLALGAIYHIMATDLGITRGAGDIYTGYENSKIGQWLLAVGAQLHSDWRMEMAALLNLLCYQVQLRLKEVR